MADTLETLTTEIGLVVSKIATTDLTLLRGYSQAKARAIASYTLLLGEGYAAGTISEEQMSQEMAELERMVLRFVRNLQALATTTIERVLRGISNLLMATLRQLTGLPLLPLPPSGGTIWGVGPAA